MEAYGTLLKVLRAGQLGHPETARMQVPGFLPKTNELTIWAFPNTKHYHQATHAQWVGRGRGFRVRIVKGFWWRESVSQGHRLSYSAMDCKGQGVLIFTNQAFCFLSSTNSTRIPFNRTVGFLSYTDGLELQTDYAHNPIHIFSNERKTLRLYSRPWTLCTVTTQQM